MKYLLLVMIVGGLIAAQVGCHQARVIKTDEAKSTAAADSGAADGNDTDTQAIEPAVVGGGFLRAVCGSYVVFSESSPEYACGVYDGDKKSTDALVLHIELKANGTVTEVPFRTLSPAEAWQVSFSLPADLALQAVEGVSVVYSFADKTYRAPAAAVLSGTATTPDRTDNFTDFPTPKSLSYPLTQMSKSWQASFDGDPSLADLNGDGQKDWLVTRGQITSANFAGGILRNTGAVQLKSNPFVVNPKKVSVDFAMAHLVETTDPNAIGAELWYNVDYGNGSIGQVFCFLKRDGLGAQTASLYTKTLTNPRVLLTQVTGLPLGFVRFAFSLDVGPSRVMLKVNGNEYGPFTFSQMTFVDTGATVLDGRNSDAAFSYVLVGVEL